MAVKQRYQVFLSSTYTDLKEERAEVIQALWELDCIPTGMEAFLASNASQWSLIQKVIDECDYYILIIGGRYGSVTSEGVSFTEKEYDYAKSLGIPILAFVHEKPEEIPTGKSEKDHELRDKLRIFREKVMSEYPVRRWTTAEQLGGLASRSLIREIRETPRPGWIRNDGRTHEELTEQVASLLTENTSLRKRFASRSDTTASTSNLAQGNDKERLYGTATFIKEGTTEQYNLKWDVETSWNYILSQIGSILVGEATESDISRLLGRLVGHHKDYPKDGYKFISSDLTPSSLTRVMVQLRALGYITKGIKKRPERDQRNYWTVTPAGDRYFLSITARKKPEPAESRKNSLDTENES